VGTLLKIWFEIRSRVPILTSHQTQTRFWKRHAKDAVLVPLTGPDQEKGTSGTYWQGYRVLAEFWTCRFWSFGGGPRHLYGHTIACADYNYSLAYEPVLLEESSSGLERYRFESDVGILTVIVYHCGIISASFKMT